MKSPMPPLTGSSGISTAGKDWCRPVTTIGEDAGDGADRDEGEEAGDEECDERGEKEVDRARQSLVELLLDEAHDVGDGERGDDLRLVADLRDVHAEHVPVLDFGLSG